MLTKLARAFLFFLSILLFFLSSLLIISIFVSDSSIAIIVEFVLASILLYLAINCWKKYRMPEPIEEIVGEETEKYYEKPKGEKQAYTGSSNAVKGNPSGSEFSNRSAERKDTTTENFEPNKDPVEEIKEAVQEIKEKMLENKNPDTFSRVLKVLQKTAFWYVIIFWILPVIVFMMIIALIN